MEPIVVTRHSTATPEQLWAVATDLERAPERMSGIDRVEVLTPGPFAEGTRWRETRTMMKREATEEMWVTAVTAPHSYTVEAESHGMHYVSSFSFVPNPAGGTDVSFSFGGEATGFVTRLMSVVTVPMMRRTIASQLGGDLDDLIAAAERGADAE